MRLTRQPAEERRKQTLLYPVNILLKSKKRKIKKYVFDKKKIDNKCKLLFMHRIKDKVCSKDLLGPPNFDVCCTFVGIERVKHCKEVLLEVQWSFRVHQHLCPLIHGWPYLLPDTFLSTKKLFLPLSSHITSYNI